MRADLLRARARVDGLELTNTSSTPVYYFAVEREALALINWAPCTQPSVCNVVPAHSATRLAFTDIALYTPAAQEAVVLYWRLLPRTVAPGYVPDSIRAIVAALR